MKRISFNRKVLFSSTSQDWTTPKDVYDELDKEFNFDFDPCPNNPSFDGLNINWGVANFVNPPYKSDLQDAFIKKAYEESLLGKVCVILIPSRTDTKRWHNYILPFASEIRFIKGRLKFGGSKNSAPFPSAIIIFNGIDERCSNCNIDLKD